LDTVAEEKKTEKSCELCKKINELPEDVDICPRIWTCVTYARPGSEYKHFVPKEGFEQLNKKLYNLIQN
jgi:hypothetical protein